ncbi:MAG: DUF4124 domain-containing protein [Myxococcota bacterium]
MRLVWLAFLASMVLASSSVAAESVVYRWADKNGVIHLSDDLSKVPEPYASLYQARIRELEAKRAERVGDRKEPPPSRARPSRNRPPTKTTGLAEREIQKRERWQKRVRQWRQELERATNTLAEREERLAQLQVNPLLRLTPQVKTQIESVEEERAQAILRLEKARKMLLETLPSEAKKEGVPLRWLL